MLYIMCGLPYSGKTTYANKLVAEQGFTKISMDDVMDEYKMSSDTMSQEDWNFVYKTGYDKLKVALKAGKNVVLDVGNLKRSERQTAFDIAESLGVEAKLVYLKIDIVEIWKRWEENEKMQYRDGLSKESLQRAIDMWEEPL